MYVKNFAEILSLDLTRRGKINFENLGAMTLGCLGWPLTAALSFSAAFAVLRSSPPVSFISVSSDNDDDDKSFTGYSLYARHCLNVGPQLLR